VGTNWRLWLRAASQGTTYFGLAMIALIWLSVHFHLPSNASARSRPPSRIRAIWRARSKSNLIRSVREIDKSLIFLRENYLKDPARFDMSHWVSHGGFLGDPTVQIGIITPDGFLRMSTAPLPRGPIHLGDREHFQFHVNSHADELFISKPITSRARGNWIVQLTRAIRRPDGSLAGVIGASLDPYHLARFYDSIDVGQEGLVAVIGFDGVVRAFAGRGPDALGRTVLEPQLLESSLSRSPNGWYFSDGGWSDAGRRLVSYPRSKDFHWS
jgi:two-component system, sensor histidine kinase